jgi:hypothetical protein
MMTVIVRSPARAADINVGPDAAAHVAEVTPRETTVDRQDR